MRTKTVNPNNAAAKTAKICAAAVGLPIDAYVGYNEQGERIGFKGIVKAASWNGKQRANGALVFDVTVAGDNGEVRDFELVTLPTRK